MRKIVAGLFMSLAPTTAMISEKSPSHDIETAVEQRSKTTGSPRLRR
jgi:hypothetical protein